MKYLTRIIWILSLISLLTDIASEMLYPILPIYLTRTLKSGGSIVGLCGVRTSMMSRYMPSFM